MRSFIAPLALAGAALAAVAWFYWPVISQRPAGAGSKVRIVWQGKPVFIHHRSPAEIERDVKAAQAK